MENLFIFSLNPIQSYNSSYSPLGKSELSQVNWTKRTYEISFGNFRFSLEYHHAQLRNFYDFYQTKIDFFTKISILTKISMFTKISIFKPKYGFFDQNFHFYQNIDSKFSFFTKISVFHSHFSQNDSHFRQKFVVLTKISIST